MKPRIVATRHVIVAETLENPSGVRISRVLQAVMGAWWQRSGPYRVGVLFGTALEAG